MGAFGAAQAKNNRANKATRRLWRMVGKHKDRSLFRGIKSKKVQTVREYSESFHLALKKDGFRMKPKGSGCFDRGKPIENATQRFVPPSSMLICTKAYFTRMCYIDAGLLRLIPPK